jgi:DNA polymerase II small subunit
MITVLINKNKFEIYDKAKEVLVDDVVGISGFGNREIIFANEIIYPDCFLSEKVKLDRDESVAFISDIHIGSANFLEENFLRFIKWLNAEVGDKKQREEALKIKYLFITGDTIDGVGIYPRQEELLNIKDIKKQYEKLAELLGKIRKDVKIILCPGQHDAVRVAEPQPFIGKDYGNALYKLENVILVSNPAMVEITNGGGKRGFRILMYHGASLMRYVNEIESLRLSNAPDNPVKIVKELLKRRHLASMHSSVIYIPNGKQDPLLIREVPDIITTGELHKADVDIYNNILIICSSCWQTTTPFEEKVGSHPDPCKVPVLNLKNREIKILDFS